jgi:hypothetical protein
VKLRGQRIELGEIEHALRALPGVDEAVVLVHADALVAYVSPAEVVHADETAEVAVEAEAPEAEAAGGGGFGAAVPFGRVAALAGTAAALPAYMLPSVVVGVREWPRTSSTKIDRNRLPAPEGGSGAAEVVAPRSAAERAARDAIAAVLGLAAEGVSVEAGFFELGGNSLVWRCSYATSCSRRSVRAHWPCRLRWYSTTRLLNSWQPSSRCRWHFRRLRQRLPPPTTAIFWCSHLFSLTAQRQHNTGVARWVPHTSPLETA